MLEITPQLFCQTLLEQMGERYACDAFSAEALWSDLREYCLAHRLNIKSHRVCFFQKNHNRVFILELSGVDEWVVEILEDQLSSGNKLIQPTLQAIYRTVNIWCVTDRAEDLMPFFRAIKAVYAQAKIHTQTYILKPFSLMGFASSVVQLLQTGRLVQRADIYRHYQTCCQRRFEDYLSSRSDLSSAFYRVLERLFKYELLAKSSHALLSDDLSLPQLELNWQRYLQMKQKVYAQNSQITINQLPLEFMVNIAIAIKRELTQAKKELKEPLSLYISALKKLLPMQRRDFEQIFTTMDGLPVTIRLLDPPLHEFLPQEEYNQKEMAKQMNISLKEVQDKVSALHELNPMLGHRGCRLGVTYPEIYDMQVEAIIEAACNVKKKGVTVYSEIMLPIISTEQEFTILKDDVHKIAKEVMQKKGIQIEYMVGTMIELPRAALIADKIANHAEFFSFGTNDLTQMTFGFSRDDVGSFVPDYIEKGILEKDPFQVLDQEGVGQLVEIGIKKGRSTRPELKVGICGEHGGNPQTISFCHKVGMNYVSCSPYRVPIARLAAAQASLQQPVSQATV